MERKDWKIRVWRKDGTYEADDTATSEAEARTQAAGWTGQRGQMTWVARIYSPRGEKVATYRRGTEVKEKEDA